MPGSRANEQPIDTATVIVVRRAAAADAARLAERLLARVEDAVLVAEAESGVVGWVHGAEQDLLESGRRCEILGLVVDPAYRSHGVGRGLVTAVEQWAANRGLEQMTVRSNVARAESHPFYQRLGYIRTKTQHAYRKALSGAPSPGGAAPRSFP